MAAPRALVALIIVVALAPGLAAIARANPAPLPEQLAVVIARSTPSADTAVASTPLPFSGNELPITYPRVGFAFGMAIYGSALKGVDEAFAKFESAYSAAGYPLPPSSGSTTWPLYLATLTVWLNPVFDVTGQVTHGADHNNELTLLGGIVSAHHAMPDAGNLSFSAGLGGGGYGFSFTRHYGSIVSATDPSGGYYTLDSIDLKGGGAYWTVQGGVTLGLGRHTALNGLIQYVGVGDVSTDTARVGRITINVSGVMFGAAFAGYF